MFSDIGSTKYAMSRVQTYGADLSAAGQNAVTPGYPAAHSIENPMVWLVGIGAVTLGLVAFSTHVRVGKFSVSAAAG